MIYFDNAATGFPKSREVISSIVHALRICGNPGRSGHDYSIKASEILYSAREEIANMFSTTPENVILCSGATLALNLSIKGLYPQKGKILISDMEHNSVFRPSNVIGDVNIFKVDLEDDENTVKNFRKALKDDVSLVVVTHASNICGRILPIDKIALECNKQNIPIIVDASQTAGYIKTNIVKSNIDVICIPGHKGLYGPMGTGALIVNPNKKIYFNTVIEGGTGIMSLDSNMPAQLPERLEAGTCAVQDFAGLTTAIRKCDFNKKYVELFLFLAEEIRKIKNMIIYGFSEKNSEKYMPVILFNHINISSSEISNYLLNKGICTRSGFHCSPLAHKKLQTGTNGAVRLSLGKYNTFKECEITVQAIKEIIKNI